MSEVQDTAAQISRANRGYRGPQQFDDFLQAKNISIDYNPDGTISRITMQRDIAGRGLTSKIMDFGYTNGVVTSIDQSIV